MPWADERPFERVVPPSSVRDHAVASGVCRALLATALSEGFRRHTRFGQGWLNGLIVLLSCVN